MLDDISFYDYFLPDELIAQYPPEKRGASRLLVAEKTTGSLEDHIFPDILNLLDEKFFLVMNDTRVVPARLPAVKTTGGRAEVFYLRGLGDHSFLALVKGKHRTNDKLFVADNVSITLEGQDGEGSWFVSSDMDVETLLNSYGKIPLPPYIARAADENDAERYQTVYAKYSGSVAAPTAGLHFTDELLDALEKNGVPSVRVTLHVGIGTFRPIKTDSLSAHKMHSEYYHISGDAAARINGYKRAGRKLIAVGTTTVRTLESAADSTGMIHPGDGESDLFIRPGYKFKAVDGIITNFHLPKSSLLVLVSALLGYENTKKAYEYAVAQRYRFFSYGDAMMIRQ